MPKEDFTVPPFSGNAMDIRPSNSNSNKPMFLVVFDPDVNVKKTKSFYLCLKLDKHDSYVEFRGQKLESLTEEIKSDPHRAFDASKQEELSVPWDKVCYVQNLSFKPVK